MVYISVIITHKLQITFLHDVDLLWAAFVYCINTCLSDLWADIRLPDITGTRKPHGTARNLRNEKVVSSISALKLFFVVANLFLIVGYIHSLAAYVFFLYGNTFVQDYLVLKFIYSRSMGHTRCPFKIGD